MATKKATLYDPASGKGTVVDVGSAQASELQSKGYSLTPNKKSNQEATLYDNAGKPTVVKVGTSEAAKLQGSGYTIQKPITDANQAADFINENQTNVFNQAEEAEAPPTRGEDSNFLADLRSTVDIFKSEVLPSDTRPEAPKLKETYADLRAEYGISELEEKVNTIDSQMELIEANLRERYDIEEGKPVAMNVIEGRLSEAEKQEQRQLDFLRRQKQTALNELNSKYAMVETMMNFTQQDYANASADYNNRFTQSIQIINTASGIAENLKTERQREQDNARANLTVMTNLMTENNLSYDDLGAGEQLQISKMEALAGLPTGFLSNIKSMKPESEIVSTTGRTDPSGNNYVDMIFRNADGSLEVKSMLTGKTRIASSGGKTAEEKAREEEVAFYNDISSMQDKLASGEVNWGQAYSTVKAKWGAPDNVIDNLLDKQTWFVEGAYENKLRQREAAKL